jgi:chemotaxis protein CheD
MSAAVAQRAGNVAPTQGMRRYRDPRFDATAVKVFPGDVYVTAAADEMLVTVVGSCVSACIRDPYTGIGGMNHFMLPEPGQVMADGERPSARYGKVAMDRLIEEIVARGGLRERLEIKLFGGGNVMQGSGSIGHRNADFAEAYLARHKLLLSGADLRGTQPRRVHYFPASGRAMILEMLDTDAAPAA